MKNLRIVIGNKRKVCRYCLATECLTIDHKKSKKRGGTDEKSNLQWLCKRCNGYKGEMSHRQFRNLLKVAEAINMDREIRGFNRLIQKA